MIQGGLPRWPDADQAGRGKVLPFVLREESVTPLRRAVDETVNQDGDVPPDTVSVMFVDKTSFWPDEERTPREPNGNGGFPVWVWVIAAAAVVGLLWWVAR